MTAAELVKYAYTANVKNDVHMSHNMEFPYPTTLQNCETCHAGKLTTAVTGVLDDSKFVAETCISCHAPKGLATKMKVKASTGAVITIHDTFVADVENNTKTSSQGRDTVCTSCHSVAAGFAPTIGKIHNGGYNPLIYADATGTKRYSTGVTVTIDKASVAANVLTIDFSAATTIGVDVTKITPTVLVGLYGYGTKDFLVAAHGRDIDTERNLEYVVGATHPRFKTVSAAGGKWQVTADLSPWAAVIADGRIKRAEIAVMPQLKNAAGSTVGLNAPSKTFDLTKNAFDAAFFSDIVKVGTGCNTCHDQLATTFHSGNRGGNIKVCRLCHESSNGGSHLEMQSRAIDSYVHSIHSFQAFDIGDIDFANPVAALEYEHHIGHVYPNFTIKNCESCHNAGTYGVPDASKSLTALLSASDTLTNKTRNIGSVPSYVVGPASRACGSCHRAGMIKEDDAGGLATFNAHTKSFGYLYDNVPTLWNAVVDKVMAQFK
jgi:OmcA/MtrC family decaheme c-type cytochrome